MKSQTATECPNCNIPYIYDRLEEFKYIQYDNAYYTYGIYKCPSCKDEIKV